MKKYLCPLFLIASNIGAGIGYYILYQQNKALAAQVNQLEQKIRALLSPSTETRQPKMQQQNQQQFYQRLQSLDNKLGEWIKKH